MAYYQGYSDDASYQPLAGSMGETEMMYYRDQYEQHWQQQQLPGSLGQERLYSGYQPTATHRYSVTSCKPTVLDQSVSCMYAVICRLVVQKK